jgi:hypothetical protein
MELETLMQHINSIAESGARSQNEIPTSEGDIDVSQVPEAIMRLALAFQDQLIALSFFHPDPTRDWQYTVNRCAFVKFNPPIEEKLVDTAFYHGLYDHP